MRGILCVVLMASCSSQAPATPVKAGDGVTVDSVTQTVAIDTTKVPEVATCAPLQVVRKTAAGWECVAQDWASIAGKPDSFPPAAHAHSSADVTDFAAASASAMGTKAPANPMNHDRYTDAEAVAAMGARSIANPMNHDRYTDAEALAAIAGTTSLGVGTGVATPAATLDVAGTVRIADGSQGAGKVLTSDAAGLASWQAPAVPQAIPSGAVMFFNLSSCPSGWTELTPARGRYLVGLPASGTLAATDGTPLSDKEDRPAGQHAHTVIDPGHSHSYVNNAVWQYYCGANYCQTQYGNSATTGSSTTGITVDNFGTVAGTNAPYLQLLVCQKT